MITKEKNSMCKYGLEREEGGTDTRPGPYAIGKLQQWIPLHTTSLLLLCPEAKSNLDEYLSKITLVVVS